MLTEVERPMTEVERAHLLCRLPPRRSAPFTWVGPKVGGAVFLALVFGLLGLIWKPILAGLSAALYVVVFVLPPIAREFLRARRGDPAAERRHELARQAVAAASTVSVQRVESRAVAEVLGDDVTIYLFDLGD